MGIVINWTDLNASAPDGFKIYRGDTPLDPGSLPAPIATVGPAIRTYEDQDVTRNKAYHYIVAAYDETLGQVLSQPITMGYFPISGIGPQTLLRGNSDSGLYGIVPNADFFTPAAFKTAAGGPGSVLNIATHWFKVIAGGKIMLIPNYPISNGVSFDAIYNAGVAYGGVAQADWAASVLTGRSVVAQNKTVQKGGFTYNVRLLRVRKQLNATDTAVGQYYGGEFDKAYSMAIRDNANPAYDGLQYGDYIVPNLVWPNHITGDLVNATTGMVRIIGDSVPSTHSQYATSGGAGYWVPVAELVF